MCPRVPKGMHVFNVASSLSQLPLDGDSTQSISQPTSNDFQLDDTEWPPSQPASPILSLHSLVPLSQPQSPKPTDIASEVEKDILPPVSSSSIYTDIS